MEAEVFDRYVVQIPIKRIIAAFGSDGLACCKVFAQFDGHDVERAFFYYPHTMDQGEVNAVCQVLAESVADELAELRNEDPQP